MSPVSMRKVIRMMSVSTGSLSFLNMVIPYSYHVFSEVTVQNDPVLGVFLKNIFVLVEAAQMARRYPRATTQQCCLVGNPQGGVLV